VLRLFLLLHFLFFTLDACDSDFSSCVLKVKDSHSIQNTTLSLPLKNNQRLIYSTKKPDGKILKYDKFFSLYLVEDTHPFAYPFSINTQRLGATAVVNEKCAKKGFIKQHQIGLTQLGIYSQKLSTPAILSDACCNVEGLVTPKGVIEKPYIRHFITTKEKNYGDLGLRVVDTKGCVRVSAVDPFFHNNPFKKGDCIVAFDKKKVKFASQLMQYILFSKINTQHKLKVRRAKTYKTFTVTTDKRYGGGMVSDTFLEREGLYFNKQLQLVSLSKKFQNYGLEIGDKLIQVNGVKVKTQKELREYLQEKKRYNSLLFERNKFQFFVHL